MKISTFVAFLFLIYETSFYLVQGIEIKKGKNISDCTKLNKYLYGNSTNISNKCCSEKEIICDNEGYITSYMLSKFIKVNSTSSFPYLSRIDQLYLNDTGLSEIPNGVFNLTTLTRLNLQKNKIDVIPPAIQNLSKLEKLDLYDNIISELPNELFNLTNLDYLNLQHNKIQVIPPAIQNLSKLEKLDLQENVINELPNELFNLTNLDYLNFQYNNIEIIPQDIKKLGHLKEFDINNNSIVQLPDELYQLTNLLFLGLSDNRIEGISPNIKNLSNLRGLNIKNNNIQELPNEIYSLTNLQFFYIGSNPLYEIKIKKFGNSTVGQCELSNINISCYESKACGIIVYNNDMKFADNDAEKYFKICNSGNHLVKEFIIIGSIAFIIIVILGTYMLIKKNKSKKHNKTDNSNDKFENDNIKFVFNEKQGIKDYKDAQSYLNNNNLNVLPVGVVLINNPENYGNYVPLFNNNKLKFNQGSSDMQNLLYSYDKTGMDMDDKKSDKTPFNATRLYEKDEPLPKYSKY